MTLFADGEMLHRPTNHPVAGYSSTCSSNTSLFYSDGSNWDSSSVGETLVHTPTGLPFDFIKFEDAYLHTQTLPFTPEKHSIESGFCNMNSITEDMSPEFLDLSLAEMMVPEQALLGYNNFATYVGPNRDAFSNHGSMSLGSESIDGDRLSPISELGTSPTEDFMVPPQTTFLDSSSMESPLRPLKHLQFTIQYNNPRTDYESSFELGSLPVESMNYTVSSYNEPSSCTTPRGPSSLRQPVAELPQISETLHRVQDEAYPDKKIQARRPTRRRVKQQKKAGGSLLSSNITIQPGADNLCTWLGCHKKFQRREHLKRHVNDSHLKKNSFPCRFCHHEFSRSDNLKTHLGLHQDPQRNHQRTPYYPEANEVIEEMNKKSIRPKTNENSSVKKRSRVSGN